MITGLTAKGTRWWMLKDSTLTRSEEVQVERFKRADKKCALLMRDMKFNAAWRIALKEICGVEMPIGTDFRLDVR